MEQQPSIIYRHDEPTKIDTANYLTLCKVGVDAANKNNWFIQLSSDAESPKWEYLGCLCSEDILLKLISFLK